VECKLRKVNFRRVSDPRRAFRLAFRVTGISDDWYRSSMGVIVISLGTRWSGKEKTGSASHEHGSADHMPRSADHEPGHSGDNPASFTYH
jgi:hypothetical protein